MIQAHFGFSCAWIMFVGNKGEVELCKLVQSVWVKLKCRLHSSGASWRQAQEFLKITCISVFFFHFQLATKKKPKKKPGPLFLAKNGMNFGSTSSDLMGTYSSRTWFFMSPRSWSSAATASSGNDSMGGWVTDPPSTC